MTIGLWIVSFLVGLLGSFSSIPNDPPAAGQTLPQTVAVFETSLQSPITSSASSLTLTANSVRGGTTLSGYNCFTIDEGSAQAEYVCGTVSGTTVSSLTRGIDPSTGTSTNATLQFSHRRGANVKITDFPALQILKAMANGEASFPNSLTLDSVATYSSSPSFTSGSNQLASVLYAQTYANNVIAGGSPTSTETIGGKVRLATRLQAASTTDSGVDAPLALTSKIATSSFGLATSSVVVTQSNGKIDPSLINQSANYTLTGQWSFTSATSTNLSVTNYIKWNNIVYIGPSSQGAFGTALRNDGSGNLSWSMPLRYESVGASGVSFGTGNGGFATSSVQLVTPANILTASSTIDVYGTNGCAANASGAETCNVYIRNALGQTFASFSMTTSGASVTQIAQWHAVIIATSSPSSVVTELNGNIIQSAGSFVASNFTNIQGSTYSNINLQTSTTTTVVYQVVTSANNPGGTNLNDVTYIANP